MCHMSTRYGLGRPCLPRGPSFLTHLRCRERQSSSRDTPVGGCQPGGGDPGCPPAKCWFFPCDECESIPVSLTGFYSYGSFCNKKHF